MPDEIVAHVLFECRGFAQFRSEILGTSKFATVLYKSGDLINFWRSGLVGITTASRHGPRQIVY